MMPREGGRLPHETQQIPGRGRDRDRILAPESENLVADIPRNSAEDAQTAEELLREYHDHQQAEFNSMGIKIAQMITDRGNIFDNEQELKFALDDLNLHEKGNEPAIKELLTGTEKKLFDAIKNGLISPSDELLSPAPETINTWVKDKHGNKLPYVITYKSNREFDISPLPVLAEFKKPSKRPPTLRTK